MTSAIRGFTCSAVETRCDDQAGSAKLIACAIELFATVLAKLDEEITDDDLTQASQLDTSSTWTYLINDQPMGDLSQRFMRGVRARIMQLVGRKSS